MMGLEWGASSIGTAVLIEENWRHTLDTAYSAFEEAWSVTNLDQEAKRGSICIHMSYWLLGNTGKEAGEGIHGWVSKATAATNPQKEGDEHLDIYAECVAGWPMGAWQEEKDAKSSVQTKYITEYLSI
jgi:hypothetical protein